MLKGFWYLGLFDGPTVPSVQGWVSHQFPCASRHQRVCWESSHMGLPGEPCPLGGQDGVGLVMVTTGLQLQPQTISLARCLEHSLVILNLDNSSNPTSWLCLIWPLPTSLTSSPGTLSLAHSGPAPGVLQFPPMHPAPSFSGPLPLLGTIACGYLNQI